jgi:hypothetical protein
MVAIAQYLKRLPSTVVGAAVVLSCLGIISTLQASRFDNLRSASAKEAIELKAEVARAQTQLRAMAALPDLGYKNLLAGWNFLQFLQYFGNTSARSQTGYALTPDFFRLIVERDPRFLTPYFYLSPANTLYAGRPDITIELLSQGLESYSPELNPEGYYLWIYKAVDQLLFLNQPQEAAKSYEMAARWADKSSSSEAKFRAASARESAQYLANNPGSKRMQASAWGIILSNAVDQATRELAIQKITQLGGKVTLTQQGGMQGVSVTLPEDK